MADDECLFSLEVIVENVENIRVSCYKPAIAVRLLDFPAVVIRSERQELSTEKTSYEIQSGKSCLFKMDKKLLHKRLQDTPLYIMLVDTCSIKTKLLASTTVSLVSCFQNILVHIEESGLDVPTVSGKKGKFIMYNLMGTEVATIKLGYRMFSFGVGMTGHVNLSLSKQMKPNQNSDILDELCAKSVKENGHFKAPSSATNINGSEHSDKILVVSKTVDEIETLKADVHTQTVAIATKRPIKESSRKCDHPELSRIRSPDNITRPPPLYYNSSSIFREPKTSYLGLERCLEPTIGENLTNPVNMSAHSEGTVKNNVQNTKRQHCDISAQTCESCHHNVPAPKINVSTQCLNDNQLGLPLIEALLNELTLVRSKYINNGLSQQVREDVTSQSKNNTVKIHEKCPPRKPQDQSKKSKKFAHSESKKIIPTKANSKGVLISRHPVKFKKSSLKCGTTRTQKLREALSKKHFHSGQSVKQADDEASFLREEIARQNNGMQADNMGEESLKHILGENKSTMTVKDRTERQEVGVQVRISDDEGPPPKNLYQDSPLYHGGLTNLVLGATYINESVVPRNAVTTTNQNDDNAHELSSLELRNEQERPSTDKRTLNTDELPKAKFSNISPIVSAGSNARYRKTEISSKDGEDHFSETRLSDECVNLVNRAVGQAERTSVRSSVKSREKPFSSESSHSNRSLVSVKKEGYHSTNDRSSDEAQEKLLETRLSDESLHLVRSSPKSLEKSLSSESRLSTTNRGLVGTIFGEVHSNDGGSSKELREGNSISSEDGLSDRNLGLVSKPVGAILSNSSYSENFDSDDSEIKGESDAS